MDVPVGLGNFKCDNGCLYCNHNAEELERILASNVDFGDSEFSEIMKEVLEGEWIPCGSDLSISILWKKGESLQRINARKLKMGFLNDARQDENRGDYYFQEVIIPAGTMCFGGGCENTGFVWFFTRGDLVQVGE